jgi:2,3-bisphosphoglycerate-independent phosphoglycerate mutase
MVSDSDPQKVDKRVSEVHAHDDTVEAKKTAKIAEDLLQRFHEILKSHPVNEERKKKGLLPANIVLCRGAGTLPELTTLSQKYGIQAACIAAVPLVRVVCKAAGMSLLNVSGATGTYDTDAKAKAKAAIQAVKSNDLVLVHMKATDIASHDGKTQEKVKMIEKLDDMVGHIVKNVDMDETFVAVTADHTTSLFTGEHEGDPVPVAITGPGVRTDDIKEFGERACARGGLGRIRGVDLMPTLMNFLGKTKKFGA